MAAAVGAAVEDAPTPWPAGLDLPAIEADGTRTFSIDPGDELTFPPGIARPGDVIVCEGRGGVTVGPPGVEIGDPARLRASTDRGGAVHATCATGFPL